MGNQANIFDDLSVVFSQERLDRYLGHIACNKNKTDALVAYSWNIELSQVLYPAIQIFEITLRNSLHRAITATYQTEYWFDAPFLDSKEKIVIEQAKNSLKKVNKKVEPGKVIAELSFGFWTSLFDIRYEHNQILWPKLLKSVFQYLPKRHRTRQYLSRELNRIRNLRNRIFHFEPIWHWQDLPAHHEQLTNLIKWLSPTAFQYLKIFDHFKQIYCDGQSNIRNNLNEILLP